MYKPTEPVIFAQGKSGRQAWRLPPAEVPSRTTEVDANAARSEDLGLPSVGELEVVRHYTRLSQKNYSVDGGFYPLGSCTMKYNPKINEEIASMPGFRDLHPLQEQDTCQGALQVYREIEERLCDLTGFDRFTFQPAAGAQGELVGLLVMRAYFNAKGEHQRTRILIPDSAHGTNPASAASAGFEVVEIPSDERGNMDLDAVRLQADERCAGLMLTNPNTLGLFEEHIHELTQIIHDAGGLCYYDGANLNAVVGLVRPGDMGFDVGHLNLHKTFSTPHGGGGPGSGPVGVTEELAAFLPWPHLYADDEGSLGWENGQSSIGSMHAFNGNFAVVLRALCYLKAMGTEGMRQVARHAVLNANYIRVQLEDIWPSAAQRSCMHECCLSGGPLKSKTGVTTLDVAKRLIDLGYHPPTTYFPLNVEEALMIEPTESEDKETLDGFASAMRQIAREAKEQPETLKQSPADQPISRPDETTAARHPILTWQQA